MIHRLLHWRSIFILIAISIIAGTVLYTRYLSRKMETEERQRVEEWVLANKVIQQSQDITALSLANFVLINNEDMPLIATDDSGRLVDYRNIDTTAFDNEQKLSQLIDEFRDANPPINWVIADSPLIQYKVYYGKTRLQKEIQYYPFFQLLVVSLFIALLIALLTTQYRSTQNQLWAGMAKETAHQLGTPITSLRGWTEILKESGQHSEIVSELEKDLDRLNLVSDRFGKIGSQPQLESVSIGGLVDEMVQYMKRRAPDRVKFEIIRPTSDTRVMASPTLINWVLENLIKNALDAIEGKGIITITIGSNAAEVFVDVKDTGKGIAPSHVSRVFTPGFTTKKRGWGLGLTLSRRIIAHYHKGSLVVKHSEVGKGTTFRIALPR